MTICSPAGCCRCHADHRAGGPMQTHVFGPAPPAAETTERQSRGGNGRAQTQLPTLTARWPKPVCTALSPELHVKPPGSGQVAHPCAIAVGVRDSEEAHLETRRRQPRHIKAHAHRPPCSHAHPSIDATSRGQPFPSRRCRNNHSALAGAAPAPGPPRATAAAATSTTSAAARRVPITPRGHAGQANAAAEGHLPPRS